MAPRFDFNTLPKCGAHARSSGHPCLRPAMANGRCYHHGGAAKIKHERYTKQTLKKRAKERNLIKEIRNSFFKH